MPLVLALVATSSTGCAMGNSSFVAACPVPVIYSAGQIMLAAAELAAMPANSVIADVWIPDYGRLRDASRACLEAGR